MRYNFLFLLLLLAVFRSYSQDIYGLEKSKKFASYLFKSGQYDLSAMEYERLLFMDEDNDTLKYNLINSYFQNEQIDKALDRTQYLYPSLADLSIRMAELYTQILILGGRFSTFDNEFKELPLKENDKRIYQFHKDFLSQNWEQVKQGTIQLSEDDHPSMGNLLMLYNKHESYKPKKPWVAGLLSAVIPGSGKFYTGNWKDGAFSFIAIGGLAFQSYRGFSKNGVSSASGWIFGAVATGFYAGNIYGSAKSAQVRNTEFWLEIEKDAKDIIRSSY
ncbi:hypothetical protein QYS48_00980 [Marivirga arenosa]|uniref:Tetratricopeptide repeat protein n=1 Tax=Marivirga arenosa TaxID=3059076 RepID=A0AA49GE80_9BACT|nr:hypothetical protein [Marivirga sp. ABR2-2]WKK85708.2 hypothetical protein QYS48_00980 [Marivirga sp. ABR2-2]